MAAPPVKKYPVRMYAHSLYDHSINAENVNNSTQNPAFVGGLFYNQGTGSFSHMGIEKTSSFEELTRNLPRNEVIRSPIQISPNAVYSQGVLQTGRSLFETANNFNYSTESSNLLGYYKPQIDFIDLTIDDDIPQLVESNYIDLTLENDLTELTMEDNPIPQTNKQSLDDEHTLPSSQYTVMGYHPSLVDIHSNLVHSVEMNPISTNKNHSLDFDYAQPPSKRIRMDDQTALVGRPMELLQGHVQGPVCNSNHLVPYGDMQAPSKHIRMDYQPVLVDRPMELPQGHVQGPVCNSNHLVPYGDTQAPSKRVRMDYQPFLVDRPMELLQGHVQGPVCDRNHLVPYGDTQPLSKRITMDYQPVLVDRPMELLQEHVQGPVCNSNHLVPYGDTQAPSKHVRMDYQPVLVDRPMELLQGHVQSPVCNSNHRVPHGDTQPSSKRIMMDYQPVLVDRPMELLQEHVQSPVRNSNHLVPHGDTQPSSKRITMDSQPDLVDRSMELLQEHVQSPVYNSNHLVPHGDTQLSSKRITMDYQPVLVDRPMELIQEHVQSPVCNSDHLVPYGESRSHVTSHANNKSDLVQQGTEKPDEEGLKEEEKSTTVIENGVENLVSLIDSFSEHQIKVHIASLNQSMSQYIGRRGVQKTEMFDSTGGSTCQLCPMEKNMFKPAPVFCASCDSCIKPHTQFFWSLDDMGKKICFCARCYRGSRGNSIAYQGGYIYKSQLKKGKNEEEKEEPWVQCDDCGRWQHQICALYNFLADTDGKASYFCPYCLLNRRIPGESLPVAFGAKDLPSTPLSDHIEQRLFRQLDKDREDRAKKLRKNIEEVPKADDLVVRVVLSSQKQLKVNQEFRSIIPHEEYPQEFQYQSKVIMLFQKIEGVDVCLFAMYVQEYGSECAPPNQRSVYISYLDSIKYFKPEIKAATGEALRTYVYQEILVGYLEYCKKQGFMTCYIWVCPPAKCDDYILYCHPESQKIPNTEKLRHWYKAMLKKSIKEGIVMDMTNMYNQFFCNNERTKISAARLPYFDGDYWSKAAENIIKDIEKQKGGELEKTAMTKRMARSMGYSDITDDNIKDILVMQKLSDIFQHYKEDFIVAHLHDTCLNCHNVITGHYWSCNQCKKFDLCSRCVNGDRKERKTHTTAYGERHTLFQVKMDNLPVDTRRGEAKLDNDLFGNRHYLLSFCQDNHYQFDTLRRAKHSSMMVLYNLKTQCGFKPPEQKQQTSYQAILEALIHASRCSTTANGCSSLACLRLKKLFYHASTCSIKRTGGCDFCVKLWMLMHDHSRRCNDACCRVPRCKDIRKIMAVIRET